MMLFLFLFLFFFFFFHFFLQLKRIQYIPCDITDFLNVCVSQRQPNAGFEIYRFLEDRYWKFPHQHIMARNVRVISISKIFSKFPTAGPLVIWEPWPAVDLLQFVIKCQHPWLRTLRLESSPIPILVQSLRVLIYQLIWNFRQSRRSSVHSMLSAAHTWAAISNSCLPVSNYVTTQLKRFIHQYRWLVVDI